jgi:hypothetical protein
MINRFSGILKLKLSISGQLGYMVTTSGTVSVTREPAVPLSRHVINLKHQLPTFEHKIHLKYNASRTYTSMQDTNIQETNRKQENTKSFKFDARVYLVGLVLSSHDFSLSRELVKTPPLHVPSKWRF